MASRYASFDTRSSTTPPSKPARSTPIPATSRALTKVQSNTTSAKNGGRSNIGAMVRNLIHKPKKTTASGGGLGERMVALAVPRDVIGEYVKKTSKGSNCSALHRKLFQRNGGEKGKGTPCKALTEIKSNTRTLAMVLRSERELLGQNKEYEAEILELKLAVEEKNREVEKLKDLCLRQREEIKALKDAILFPDVMNAQLQNLLEKQGSELKQAKEVIPSLQKQVTSLTGQLLCLAEDLAEVKADKRNSRSFSDGPLGSPRTPIYEGDGVDSLDFGSMRPIISANPDDMLSRDFNPCLTPCFSKSKSKERADMSSEDSLSDDDSFGDNTLTSSQDCGSSKGEQMYKSSDPYKQSTLSSTSHKTSKSDGMKSSLGKADARNPWKVPHF